MGARAAISFFHAKDHKFLLPLGTIPCVVEKFSGLLTSVLLYNEDLGNGFLGERKEDWVTKGIRK
jgi:hypothetical protein